VRVLCSALGRCRSVGCDQSSDMERERRSGQCPCVVGVTRVSVAHGRQPATVGSTSFQWNTYHFINFPSMLVASMATAVLPLVPLVPLVAASKVELPPQVHHQLLHSGRPQVGLWKALLSDAQHRQASQLR
jgi:hypothetical protein